MKQNTRLHNVAFVALAAIGLALPALAQEADTRQLMGPVEKTPEDYSPFVNQNFPDRVLWGATHIHTALSADAGLTGVTLGPADMFRYARGEVVTIDSGLKVRLDRPLDWFAITDHAEYMGLADQIRSGGPCAARQPDRQKMVRHVSSRAARRPSRPATKLSTPSSKTRKRSRTLSSRPGLGRKPTTRPSGSTSRAFSPRFTASNGRQRPKATIFIAPSFSATTWTA